jgi:hypothetical protein
MLLDKDLNGQWIFVIMVSFLENSLVRHMAFPWLSCLAQAGREPHAQTWE